MAKLLLLIVSVCVTTVHADLLGRYFQGRNIVNGVIETDGLVEQFSRVDANIDYWNGTSTYRWEPVAGYPSSYTVEWTGFIKIEVPGEYGFGTISDDGSQVWINGQMVVNNGETQWFDWEDNITEHDPGDPNQPVYLHPGFHAITVRFYEAGSYDGIQLWWLVPGSGPSDIPYYGTTFHGVRPTYNPNTNWSLTPAAVLYTPDQVDALACQKDLNQDGLVNLDDFQILAANWLSAQPFSGGDFSGDGFVGIEDMMEFVWVWLMSCPATMEF